MCRQTLPCPLCCQSNFPNIDALRLSLIKVTSRPLKCPICDDVLLGLDKLTIHLFGHSVLQDENEKDSKNIVKVENENIEKIKIDADADADEEAKKKKVLESLKSARKNHRKSVTLATTKTKAVTSPILAPSPSSQSTMQPIIYKFKCEFCGFLFDNGQLLAMHVTLFHQQASAKSAAKKSEPDNNEKFPCHLCSKSFKMKGSLKIHIRVVHPNAKPVKIETFSSPNSPLQQNSKSPASPCNRKNTPISSPQHQSGTDQIAKMWECDICAKSFTTKYFLKKHKRLHTGEMPYACNICGKTFTFQQSYHKHLLYHSDEKPHVCTICKRAFKELSTLHNHERIHSGEKPFKCENCGKCFRQRVSYLVHKRIHTGVMPYKCTACDKSFRYKVSQRTHKCTAQPPGTVVRQVDLLQKLLQTPPVSLQNDGNGQKTEETDLISKSLDDFVKESYAKMGLEIENSPYISCNGNDNIPHIENLCLLSPSRELLNFDNSGLEMESLKLDLLYDNVNNMQL